MKVTNSKKTKKVTGLYKLLEEHKKEFQQLENGKIKCLLTGHEFLPSEENLQAHLKSKSYKKASEAQFDITEYEDVLITHKDGENFLFCKITGAKVPKKKTAIEKHVNGKRFKSRFQEYKAQLEEGEQLIDEEAQQQEEDIQNEEQAEQQEQEDKQQAPPAKKNSKHVKSNNKKSKDQPKKEEKTNGQPKPKENGKPKAKQNGKPKQNRNGNPKAKKIGKKYNNKKGLSKQKIIKKFRK